MKLHLIIFFSFISFYSCTKKSTTSKITVDNSSFETNKLKSNILVAISPDGKKHIRFLPLAKQNLELLNGKWKFYSFIWSDDFGLEGNIKCDFIEKSLEGDELKLRFSPSEDKCLTIHKLNLLKANWELITCRNIYDVKNFNDINLCDKSLKNRGYATFYKLILQEYDQIDDDRTFNSNKIESKCYSFDQNSPFGQSVTEESKKLRLPLLPSELLTMKIEFFYTEDGCNSNKIPQDIDQFDLGYLPTNRSKVFHTEDYSQGRIFVSNSEKMVCKGSRVTNKFAGGTGTKNSPLILCTPQQLNEFTKNPDQYKDKNFESSSDLMFQF